MTLDLVNSTSLALSSRNAFGLTFDGKIGDSEHGACDAERALIMDQATAKRAENQFEIPPPAVILNITSWNSTRMTQSNGGVASAKKQRWTAGLDAASAKRAQRSSYPTSHCTSTEWEVSPCYHTSSPMSTANIENMHPSFKLLFLPIRFSSHRVLLEHG